MRSVATRPVTIPTAVSAFPTEVIWLSPPSASQSATDIATETQAMTVSRSARRLRPNERSRYSRRREAE